MPMQEPDPATANNSRRTESTAPLTDSTSVRAQRPRSTRAQLVIAVLLGLFALWAAADVLIPLLLAMFFALIGNPILRALQRWYVPRFAGALLVLIVGLSGLGLLIDQLAAPASAWVHQAPAQLRTLAPKFRELLRPVREADSAARSIAQAAGSGTAAPVQVVKTESDDAWRIFLSTPRKIASVLAVVLLTYFFMVFGESLQHKAIAMLADAERRRVSAQILEDIEREISRYVLTISTINAIVGALLASGLVLIGLTPQQAVLWGTLAAILNFAPYIGPLIGVGAMLLMGFTSFHGWFASLLPAAIYLGLHVLEGEIVTPIVLGKRMAISPLILIVALMLFASLWGVAGLLLAVPILACTKIVLAHIEGTRAWAGLLE
jgi:predicted PurR-regulated permease PerM